MPDVPLDSTARHTACEAREQFERFRSQHLIGSAAARRR